MHCRWGRACALLVLISWLSSCSLFSSDEENEPAELQDFDEIVELDSLWSRRIGDQGEEELYIRLTPAIDGDRIYAANVDGKVFAIDRREDDRLWKVDVDAQLLSAVGAGEGLVLVGSTEGILIALKQEDGSELWRVPLSSEMLAAPQVEAGMVVVQTMDGSASGLKAATGETVWTYNTTLPSLTLRMSGTPVLDNGTAYMAFASGKVIALDSESGLLRWQQTVALPKGRNELERLINFDGKLLVTGSDVYAGSYQGSVAAVDKNQGRISWSEEASVLGALAADKGSVYFTQSDDAVVGLKMATARRFWENRDFARRQLTAPVVLGDFLVVGDSEGYLHVLRQSDGTVAGREHVGGDGIRNALLSDGETLYVLTNSGKLRAYQLAEP